MSLETMTDDDRPAALLAGFVVTAIAAIALRDPAILTAFPLFILAAGIRE